VNSLGSIPDSGIRGIIEFCAESDPLRGIGPSYVCDMSQSNDLVLDRCPDFLTIDV